MKNAISTTLNQKEQRVLGALQGRVLTLSEIAAACFKSHGVSSKKRGNSWVRNSLRKLRDVGLVERTNPGEYRARYRLAAAPKWLDAPQPTASSAEVR